MNGTIINEIDSKEISHFKNEIFQNKILIEKFEEKIKYKKL